MRYFALGVISWTVLPTALAQSPPSPPNIVVILADDLGWGDLGCYGNRQIRTPNLDRLASQGTLFTQFYSCGSVCSPSRTAWLTGHFPARHGMHGHLAEPEANKARAMPPFLDPRVPTLPRLLREAGYSTAHVGKWHLGHGRGAPPPREYGFDGSFCMACSELALRDTPGLRAESSEIFVSQAINFIEAERERPFYLQLWLLDVHARLTPSQEQMQPYRSLLGATRVYYSAVTNMDRQIGRLLARLDELGLSRNTIVLFSSDNGPEEILINSASEHGVGSPGPFRGRKRSLYEGGIRVPLIVRWPAEMPAGRVDDETVLSAVDFLPSMCALTGTPVPRRLPLDGENLVEAFRGQSVARRDPLMWEWRYSIPGHVLNKSPVLAIREGNWKLLLNPDRSRVELYDIPNDPSELNNLAAAEPEVVEKLAAQVLAWGSSLPPGPFDPDAGSNQYPWPGGRTRGTTSRPG